jgi:hypothetical protein
MSAGVDEDVGLLPSKETQELLLDLYFTYVHPSFPIIHKKEFFEIFRNELRCPPPLTLFCLTGMQESGTGFSKRVVPGVRHVRRPSQQILVPINPTTAPNPDPPPPNHVLHRRAVRLAHDAAHTHASRPALGRPLDVDRRGRLPRPRQGHTRPELRELAPVNVPGAPAARVPRDRDRGDGPGVGVRRYGGAHGAGFGPPSRGRRVGTCQPRWEAVQGLGTDREEEDLVWVRDYGQVRFDLYW